MSGDWLRSGIGLSAVVLCCTLLSCGSKNDTAAKDGSAAPAATTTESSTPPAGSESSTSGAVEGIDACSMLTVDEVSSITGIKMKSEGSQNNGCAYAPAEMAGLFGGVTLSVIDNRQAYDMLVSGEPVAGLGESAVTSPGSLSVWKNNKGALINFINPPETMDTKAMLKQMGEKIVSRM